MSRTNIDIDDELIAAVMETRARWADIYRAVRRSGHTPRATMGCIIAAIAFRTGAELVHRDIDFGRIAAVLPGLATQSLLDDPA